MILVRKLMVIICVLIIHTSAVGSELLMVRVKQAFPEAMTELQNAIIKRGYKIARVQRVDIGLTTANYKTDLYRVVFFGKAEEMERVSRAHPDFVAFLPLNVSIFAEDGQTLLVAVNPDQLAEMYPDRNLKVYLKRWKVDIEAILRNVAAAK